MRYTLDRCEENLIAIQLRFTRIARAGGWRASQQSAGAGRRERPAAGRVVWRAWELPCEIEFSCRSRHSCRACTACVARMSGGGVVPPRSGLFAHTAGGRGSLLSLIPLLSARTARRGGPHFRRQHARNCRMDDAPPEDAAAARGGEGEQDDVRAMRFSSRPPACCLRYAQRTLVCDLSLARAGRRGVARRWPRQLRQRSAHGSSCVADAGMRSRRLSAST
jgi:hypothetical protein